MRQTNVKTWKKLAHCWNQQCYAKNNHLTAALVALSEFAYNNNNNNNNNLQEDLCATWLRYGTSGWLDTTRRVGELSGALCRFLLQDSSFEFTQKSSSGLLLLNHRTVYSNVSIALAVRTVCTYTMYTVCACALWSPSALLRHNARLRSLIQAGSAANLLMPSLVWQIWNKDKREPPPPPLPDRLAYCWPV